MSEPQILWVLSVVASAAIATSVVTKLWLRPAFYAVKAAIIHVAKTDELLNVQLVNGVEEPLVVQLQALAVYVTDSSRATQKWRDISDDRHREIQTALAKGEKRFYELESKIEDHAKLPPTA